MKKYILVKWPDSQSFMEHERFNECLLVQDIDNHEQVGSSAYMVPEDLYREIISELEYGDLGVTVNGDGIVTQYFLINRHERGKYYYTNGGIEINSNNKICSVFKPDFCAIITRKATKEEIIQFKKILEFNDCYWDIVRHCIKKYVTLTDDMI